MCEGIIDGMPAENAKKLTSFWILYEHLYFLHKREGFVDGLKMQKVFRILSKHFTFCACANATLMVCSLKYIFKNLLNKFLDSI
jgi:hypothetical protein